MDDIPVLTPLEAERKELESVEAALARTPRLAELLRYLAAKYFEGETATLTEYNIATEVFGRKKTDFVSSEDAIARVETHRLRKRLKAFYEGEGKDHEIQISIPPRTFTPVFLRCSEQATTAPLPTPSFPVSSETPVDEGRVTATSGEQTRLDALPPVGSSTPGSGNRRWNWVYPAIAFVIVLLATLALRTWRGRREPGVSHTVAVSSGVPARPKSLPALYVSVPFRMIAGYKGPAQRDSLGNFWQGEQYSRGGWALQQASVVIPRTNDALLFQYGRAGDSSYDIPLKPGLYELHLYFLQPSETAQAVQSEDSENQAIFRVWLNDKPVLKELDIASDAMGRNIADERVFRDVSPGEDGVLHIHLTTVVGTPSIRAIAVLPGKSHQQLPIRLATQPIPVLDHNEVLWGPDNYFIGGRHLTHNLPKPGLPSAEIMSAERYGHFTYSLPVDTRDEYTVELYFAELFFGGSEAPGGGVGSRVFKVMCNGNTLLDNFDIYKEAGSFHLVKKTFYHLKPSAQGKLNLAFEPIANYATVSAIEVQDESK